MGASPVISAIPCSANMMGVRKKNPWLDYDVVIEVTPTAESLTYSFYIINTGAFTVDWGDGTTEEKTGTAAYSHTYAEAGDYFVKIKTVGNIARLYFGNQNAANGALVKSVPRCQLPYVNSMYNTFYQCSNLESIEKGAVIGNGNVTNFQNVFFNCRKLTAIPAGIDWSHAINLQTAFNNCLSLTALSESFAIAASVTSMGSAFNGCTSLTALPLFPATFTGSSIAVNSAFNGCTAMRGTAPASALWEDTGKTWNSSLCFRNCTNLTNYAEIPSTWK